MLHHRTRNRAATRAVLLGGLAAAFPANADDLTITSSVSTPVATATAANNSPGNITIAAGGGLAVTSGTAATINSSNSISSSGSIAATATSNATGVLINGAGGINANFYTNGAISAGNTGGANNTGLLVSGGPVTGSITNGTSASLIVTGDTSTGVSIAAPVTGNVSLRSIGVGGLTSNAISVSAPITGNLSLLGTNSSTGSGGYGLLITAPVSGTITNGGAISVGTAATVDASNNTVAALSGIAATRIAASVGGGFINDRYYIDASGVPVAAASVDTTVDTLVIGGVSSVGSGSALWIAPNASAPQAITLGAAGTGDDAYAVVNRGTITAVGSSTGNAATAVLIGGGGAATTLQGGFNSQANGAISANALNATATAIDLQAGAVVPVLRNQGSITAGTTLTAATNSVPVSAGGVASGILIEAGASLPTLTNSGSISVASAGANNNSYGIIDKSGTLTAITNSGTITATVSSGSGAAARAVDLSASNANVTLANSGTITGAVVFGNGNSTLALSGGSIAGAVSFGTGRNLLTMNGASTFSGALTSGAPIGVTLADTAKLDLSKSSLSLASIAASGSSIVTVPVGAAGVALNVSGAASFTQGSVIQLSLQSLAAQQNLTVVQAGGGVTTDHLATLIDASSAPYLFTAGATTQTATTIGITLNRKTADQIGLVGSQAALFNQSLVALSAPSAEASAIANLPDQASVVAAYRQVAPPSVGRGALRVAESIADVGFGAAANRLAVVEDMRHHGVPDVGLWAQELGDFASQSAGTNELAFHTDGFGLAAGIDTPLLGLDAVGVALLLNGTTLHQAQGGTLPELKTKISTSGVEPYLSWSWKALFVQANGLAARASYRNDRTATIGTLSDAITSHWTGTQFGAGLTVGARLDFGHFRLTPSNALTWNRLTQNGYTEQGGGPLALDVAKQTDTATFDTGRLAFAYLLPIDEDSSVKLEVHGGYMHQFNAKPTETVATFVGGGDAVTLLGDTVHGNEKSYGAAVGFVQEGVAGQIAYDRRQSQGFHDQSVAATMGITF